MLDQASGVNLERVEAAPTCDPRSKSQHLAVCRSDQVLYQKTTGLEELEFINQALPEIALNEIDTSTVMVGKRFQAPLMIAPMTGGTPKGHEINRHLARVAERWQIGFGVGSQRIAIEDKSRIQYFKLRDLAPSIAMFANIGGAQLVRGWGVDEALCAVDMIEADALFIHLNAMQEAIQGADHDFTGLTEKIGQVSSALNKRGIPVFVREVGFGISVDATRRLIDCGVSGIDCAGAGGTSWAKVEALCAKSERRKNMGGTFGEWGIPTSQSIQNVRRVCDQIPLIATGGLRSGIDIAKALALGANCTAMARPFLLKAEEGEDALEQFIAETILELRICMFGVGAKDLIALRTSPLTHRL